MASLHLAGLAAQIPQSTASATATQVAEAIKAPATAGKVTSAGAGSPNLLMLTRSSTVTNEPPPTSTVVECRR